MDYNLTFLIISFTVIVSFFYYTKCKEFEKEFLILNKKYDKAIIENDNYKLRIKDLQKYKNDVSKTFKILDNELTHINNHVEKQTQMNRQNMETNNVNLLTADMLNNLINNMNQESLFPSISHINLNTVRRPTTNTVNERNSTENNISNRNEVPDEVAGENTSEVPDEVTNEDVIDKNENIQTRVVGDALMNNLTISGLPNPYQRMRI